MFYSERNRLKKMQEREAAGELLWNGKIPEALRVKVSRLAVSFERDLNDRPGHPYRTRVDVRATAQMLLIRDRGVRSLVNGSDAQRDMQNYLDTCSNDDFPDVLEALYAAMQREDMIIRATTIADQFEELLNQLLESYRINYSLVNGEVVPFESRELHVEVIKPALLLLAKPGWEKVEKPYQDAFHELANGKPDNAVTDATTALQEGLRMLGCKGTDFAQLLRSAKSTLLEGADQKLVDATDLLIKWASSTRVNDGDTHKTTNTTKQRAWLVIHLVGILLLYLSEDKKPKNDTHPHHPNSIGS